MQQPETVMYPGAIQVTYLEIVHIDLSTPHEKDSVVMLKHAPVPRDVTVERIHVGQEQRDLSIRLQDDFEHLKPEHLPHKVRALVPKVPLV